jgi:hypothetical protein
MPVWEGGARDFLATGALFIRAPRLPTARVVTTIHHLIDEDVQNAPQLAEVINRFQGADFYVSHNCAFEQSFFAAQGVEPARAGRRRATQNCRTMARAQAMAGSMKARKSGSDRMASWVAVVCGADRCSQIRYWRIRARAIALRS